ncbi:MAG: 50S ribosomal protein L23 [Candidatus Diapherotrites archaeon CG10_big_fil_rev_8_21_14_0_10_31_34]|nr:MAG: 50S ribosomal protein L23 [Candidatus Diapherotrites archaeon CG10_big_fil_rev_8_21_14_0_10_31_34]
MSLKDYEIVIHPLISEKAVNMIEAENKICFIVNDKTNKKQVKENIEKLYKVKVDSVRVIRDRKGRKKAIVKINKEFKAGDIAIKLGVL